MLAIEQLPGPGAGRDSDPVLPLLHEDRRCLTDPAHEKATDGIAGDDRVEEPLHHHLVVDLEAEQATVRVVATSGEEVDRVVLPRE